MSARLESSHPSASLEQAEETLSVLGQKSLHKGSLSLSKLQQKDVTTKEDAVATRWSHMGMVTIGLTSEHKGMKIGKWTLKQELRAETGGRAGQFCPEMSTLTPTHAHGPQRLCLSDTLSPWTRLPSELLESSEWHSEVYVTCHRPEKATYFSITSVWTDKTPPS